MNRTEALLASLAEECGETTQRATKALRFGLNEIQMGQELTNAERIIYEFNDIVAVMEILHAEGHLSRVIDQQYIALKKQKIEKHFQYSKEIGTVSGK